MPRYSTRQRDHDADLPPTKITGESLREVGIVFGYLWPYRGKILAALAALLVSSTLALAFPYVVGNLVDGALAGRLTDPSTGFWHGNINHIALALLVILAFQAVFTFFQSYLFTEVGERGLVGLRGDTYSQLIHLPLAFFSQRRVGELTSRIAADLALIQDTIIVTLPHLFRQIALLIGGIVLITVTSPRLTLVMLAALPGLILVAALFGRRIRQAARDAQDRLAETNVIVEETLQGVTNVKAFTNEAYESQRYRAGLQTFLTYALRGARYRGAFIAFIVFALFGAIVVVMWYGAGLVQSGDLSVGELTRFLLYTMFVGGALGSFADLYSQLQRAIGATQRVREILNETPEVLDNSAFFSEEGKKTSRPRGDVRFEQVAFSYPSRKEVPVLRDITLAAQAGERIALVGPSGGGKSTIVALLLRFYEPDAGRILIDGRDARAYTLTELRRHMAVVPQDVLLFGGSIADNIAYGKPGASQAEIETAARQANAHDFIMSFPQGYATLVGERGIQLSGGQRQRVAIARAILKDPAILILDEATSALDSESESLVQQALETLMHGRTSFIIAHRLATVRTADRIHVIKDGVTVEAGTHAELIEREHGVYRMLSELQFDLR
ncbi:MAG: ABC transporter ATP-binding protein [Gemmataceae bacterium]